MRFLTALFFSILLTACQAGLPPVPNGEAERDAEAQELIRVSLSNRLMENTLELYRSRIKLMFAENAAGGGEIGPIVDAEMEKLAGPEHQRLVDGLVPVYRRMFTAEEIHQLLSFYQTDVAKKSMQVSGQIAAESQDFIRAWSENFGNKLLEGVDGQLTAAEAQAR